MKFVDITAYECKTGIDGAYMLDIMHHIPREAVLPLLEQIYAKLTILILT